MRRVSRWWWFAFAALSVAASSCTLLVGTFEGPGGTGGAPPTSSSQGSGAMMAGSSSGQGTGGGDGGTGGMTVCVNPVTDCPSPANVCVVPICTAGVCKTQDLAVGTMKKQNVPGDCHDSQCDGMGHVDMMVIDTANLPPVTNPCIAGTCDPQGKEGTTPLTAGTSCTIGGTVCDGNGQCVACLKSADCTGGESCSPTHFCVPPSCTDMVQDNQETDTDCGGGGSNPCSPCADGKKCLVGTDCASGVCGSGKTCSVATCSDNVQNETETDTDCGGSDGCPKCGPSKKCMAGTDCAGGQCGGGTCTPDCFDAVQNGNETDTDCGGSCAAKCAVGKKCNGDSDCASTACDMGTSLCVASQCSDHRLDGNETDTDCGGGTCTPCAVGKSCKIDSDCSSNACDALSLLCLTSQCSDHQKDGQETDVDCGGPACVTRCAVNQMCMADTDCASVACDTTTLKCDTSHCMDGHKDGDETDLDCGGATCGKCATGKSCKVATDCLSAACNISTLKCATQCTDGIKNGAETDVDCGGGTCPSCALNLHCSVDTDCMTNACDGTGFTCVSNQCADHRKDGAETDFDCGGGTCAACGAGKMCNLDFDCASNACDGLSGLCVSNQCIDHRVDGTETDTDCGGSTCGTCGTGKKCTTNFDCTNGICSASTPHVCN